MLIGVELVGGAKEFLLLDKYNTTAAVKEAHAKFGEQVRRVVTLRVSGGGRRIAEGKELFVRKE